MTAARRTRDQIGRFYDTLISPRQLIFHRDFDVVSGVTVVRDLTLEVIMAPDVTLNVPTHLRYDLRESDGEWAIERLCPTRPRPESPAYFASG